MRLFYWLQYGASQHVDCAVFLIFIDLVFPLLQIVVCPLKFVFPRGAFPVADLYNLQHCEIIFFNGDFGKVTAGCFYCYLPYGIFVIFSSVFADFAVTFAFIALGKAMSVQVRSNSSAYLHNFAPLRKSFSSMTILGKLRQAVFTVPALRFFDTVWQRVVA